MINLSSLEKTDCSSIPVAVEFKFYLIFSFFILILVTKVVIGLWFSFYVFLSFKF